MVDTPVRTCWRWPQCHCASCPFDARWAWDDQRRDIALARAPEAKALPVLVAWLQRHGEYEVKFDGDPRWYRAVPLSFERFAGVV